MAFIMSQVLIVTKQVFNINMQVNSNQLYTWLLYVKKNKSFFARLLYFLYYCMPKLGFFEFVKYYEEYKITFFISSLNNLK